MSAPKGPGNAGLPTPKVLADLRERMKDLATAAAIVASKSDRARFVKQLEQEQTLYKHLLALHKDAATATEKEQKAASKLGESWKAVGAIGRVAFGALAGLSGIGATIGGTAGLASPAMMQQFTLAMRDLGAVVGRILLPVFDAFIKTIRGLADFIISLPPGVKSLATAFAFVAVGIGVGIVAVNALTAAFAALDVASGGVLIAIGAAITGLAGLAYWFSQTSAGGKAMNGLFEAFKPVVDSVTTLFDALADTFGELVSAMAELAASLGLIDGNILRLVTGTLKALVDSLTYTVVLVGELARAMSQPAGFMALGSVLDRVADKMKKLRDEVEKAKKSSVGAAPGKAGFFSLEQLGKNVAVSAIEAGNAKSQAEAEKKAREEQEAKDKEDREKKIVINTEKAAIAAANIAATIGPFIGAAKRLWGF